MLSKSEAFEFLLRYWGFIKGDNRKESLRKMKDAKVIIKRVEDKGQYKARVTVQILNPVPKTAKFFQQVDPDSVVLNGTHNVITKLFDTEEQGRQWANNMLLAVMRKSGNQVQQHQYINNSEIDITFFQIDPYHPYDHYEPSLVGKPDKPFCFGDHESDCSSCVSHADHEAKKRKDEIPPCFGTYSYETCPMVTNSLKEGFHIRCSCAASCIDQLKKPICFGEYENCSELSVTSSDVLGCLFKSSCEKLYKLRKPKKDTSKEPYAKYRVDYLLSDGEINDFFPNFECAFSHILDANLPLWAIDVKVRVDGKWVDWGSVKGKPFSTIMKKIKKEKEPKGKYNEHYRWCSSCFYVYDNSSPICNDCYMQKENSEK